MVESRGLLQPNHTCPSPATALNESGAADLSIIVTDLESDSVEPALLMARTAKV